MEPEHAPVDAHAAAADPENARKKPRQRPGRHQEHSEFNQLGEMKTRDHAAPQKPGCFVISFRFQGRR